MKEEGGRLPSECKQIQIHLNPGTIDLENCNHFCFNKVLSYQKAIFSIPHPEN